MYSRATIFALAAPAVLAYPSPQQTIPSTASATSTQTSAETLTTEVITATISGQPTTFTHTNEARMSTAADGTRNLYLADPLFKKVVDLVYDRKVCPDAPDRPGKVTTTSASNTSVPTISTISTASFDLSVTLATSGPSANPSTASPAPSPSGNPRPTSCSINGEQVCDPNDCTVFGVCDWGKYVWRDVAAGTECQNGTIVGVGIYSTTGHKRSEPVHGVAVDTSSTHSKRDDSAPYLLDRPTPSFCFDDDMQAIVDGMKPGGNFTEFIGLSNVVPGDEVKVLPADNTNFTQYVETWEQYALYDPDLLWVDRGQLKESVDRAAYFLLYPENWYEQFEAEAELYS